MMTTSPLNESNMLWNDIVKLCDTSGLTRIFYSKMLCYVESSVKQNQGCTR